VDTFDDGEEVRFCRMDNIVGDAGAPGLACWLLDKPKSLLVSALESPMFAVAKRDANWRQAMLEEMKAIEITRPRSRVAN
jgi:hypothetical protein